MTKLKTAIGAILCVAMVHVWSVQIASATVITFKDGLDSYLGTEDNSMRQGGGSHLNYGSRNEILTGAAASGDARTGLIRFDITSLAGKYKAINSVTLRLNVKSTGGRDIIVNRLRDRGAGNNWVEGDSNGAAEAGASDWVDRQHTSAAWATSDAGSTTVDHYADILAAPDITSTGWVSFNLSPTSFTLEDMIDEWVTMSDNAGLRLERAPSSSSVQTIFYSSENGTQSLNPELIIDFVPTPEPSTAVLALVGLVGCVVFRRRRRIKNVAK